MILLWGTIDSIVAGVTASGLLPGPSAGRCDARHACSEAAPADHAIANRLIDSATIEYRHHHADTDRPRGRQPDSADGDAPRRHVVVRPVHSLRRQLPGLHPSRRGRICCRSRPSSISDVATVAVARSLTQFLSPAGRYEGSTSMPAPSPGCRIATSHTPAFTSPTRTCGTRSTTPAEPSKARSIDFPSLTTRSISCCSNPCSRTCCPPTSRPTRQRSAAC